MAGHVVNPSTEFEDPPPIRFQIKSNQIYLPAHIMKEKNR